MNNVLLRRTLVTALLAVFVIYLGLISVDYAGKVGIAGFHFVRPEALTFPNSELKPIIIAGLLLLLAGTFSLKKYDWLLDILVLPILFFITASIFNLIYQPAHYVSAAKFSGYSTVLTLSIQENKSVYSILSEYNNLLDTREMVFQDQTVSLKANHLTTHPPGLYIVANYLYHNYQPNADMNALAGKTGEQFHSITKTLVLLAELTIVFTYLAGRLIGDRKSGLLAAILTFGVIAIFGYIPYFDLLNMALIMIGLAILLVGQNRWNYLLSGLVVAINSAITFGVLPVALIFPPIIAYYKKTPLKTFWRLLTYYLLPVLGMIVIYRLYNFNYIHGLSQASLNLERDYNHLRQYWPALRQNSSELVSHFSVLNTAILLSAIAGSLVLYFKKREREFIFPTVLLAILALEVISGQAKGEMARTVMFFYPLLAWSVVLSFKRFNKYLWWPLLFAIVLLTEVSITLGFFSKNALAHLFIQ